MVVVGSGAIGSEFAWFYAALGVKVISGPNYRDDGYCTYFFLDPDGNIVHFAKWKDDRGMFKK